MTTLRTMAALATAGAIAGGARADLATAASSQEDYDQRFIGFDDFGVVDPDTGAFHTVTQLYEGKYKKPLAAPEFYRLVGREDLAQEYARRDTRRNALMGAGLVVLLGTAVASSAVALGGQPDPCPTGFDFAAFNACVSRQSDDGHSRMVTAAAIGVGGAIFGAVLFIAGLTTNPNPVDLVQMRMLADQYNQKLKQQVGWRVVPLSAPDRTGLAVDLRF
jgi:hypothetical protein